jgi:hypothetical protein
LKARDVDFDSYPDVAKTKVEWKRGRKFVGKRSARLRVRLGSLSFC